MPISIQTDERRQILVATVTGQVTFAACQEFIGSVRTGDRRAWTLIFDMTDATTDITLEQVPSLALNVRAALRREGLRATTVLVAGSDEQFDLMHLYRLMCEQDGVNAINVFRTRQEADTWLGL
jgi:hypothetical protein